MTLGSDEEHGRFMAALGRAFSEPASASEVARVMCNASRDHVAGHGRHDADQYGPCSSHEEAAEALLASGAQVVLAATEVTP